MTWNWQQAGRDPIMTLDIDRRMLLRLLGGAAGGALAATPRRADAQASDAVAIGWPSDVPSWDPNQRFTPDAQAIFKLVFDQPLEQSPKLDLIPNLVVKWELAPDGLSMRVELRDDVAFHNGDKLTTEDFRYPSSSASRPATRSTPPIRGARSPTSRCSRRPRR
jgi:peptide/nickel transport system substrate-binding protein